MMYHFALNIEKDLSQIKSKMTSAFDPTSSTHQGVEKYS